MNRRRCRWGRTLVCPGNHVIDGCMPPRKGAILWWLFLLRSHPECKSGIRYKCGCAATIRPFAKSLWTSIHLYVTLSCSVTSLLPLSLLRCRRRQQRGIANIERRRHKSCRGSERRRCGRERRRHESCRGTSGETASLFEVRSVRAVGIFSVACDCEEKWS